MLVQKFIPGTKNSIIFIIGWQLAIISTLFSQSIYPQFDQITTEHGLSNNRINNTIKDHKGFIWIATADGLNRYDGYKFKIFRYDPNDSTSLSDNFVYSICEDRLGNIWVGTRSAGLNKFNRKTGKFTRVKFYPSNTSPKEQQQLNSIYGIYEDPYEKNNVIWVFTAKRAKTKIFNDNENTYYMGIQSGNNCIIADSTILWMGGPTGLRKFNKNTGTVTFIPYYKNKNQGGVDISITDMYQDSDGLIWLACWHDGLISFDPITETYTGYKYNPDYPPGIGSNVVFDIKEDKSGKLWIVTAGDGYYQYDKKTGEFTCYKKPETYTRLGLNFWGKLYLDDTNIHWITTKNNGILKYTPRKEKFNQFNLSSETEKEVDIRAFYKDKTDSLWVSSVDALYKFDTQTLVRIRITFSGWVPKEED
jgi:ligand-binding sensor domain-containing protein